jgi:uncharacterized protein (DUF934 family)
MSLLNSSHSPALVTEAGALIADAHVLLGDDEALSADGSGVLSFARAVSELDSLNGHYAVRILPGDDVRLLLPFIDKIGLIEVAFPGFRDGRGYSTARILREAGYTGALRAVGDVLRDQLFHMLRCGFDEFLVKDKDPVQAIAAAKARFGTFYQGAADANRPAWALRHPTAEA